MKSRNKIWVALLASGLGLVILATAVFAGVINRGRGYHINRQAVFTLPESATTQSTTFTAVPGLHPTLTAKGGATATLSVTTSGGASAFRIRDDQGQVLVPGEFKVEQSNDATSHSFTFAGDLGRGADCHTFLVEWRSVSGDEITLEDGAVAFTYNHDETIRGSRFRCQ